VLNETQTRILRRIADHIDAYRAGQASSVTMLNDIWGLISAAEVRGTPEGHEVESLYYAASVADDARQPWIPTEQRTTDAHVQAALQRLRDWALSVDHDGTSHDAGSGGIPGH
jgi:hypothetical protein